MTEEIIIDCGWYRNGSCGCATEDKRCEQIKLCKFKDDKLKQQLKRLEQENKELIEDNLNLSKENKELQAYKDINEDFKKAWDELNEKYRQLRYALEEIKKMVTSPYTGKPRNVLNIINEVLNDSRE